MNGWKAVAGARVTRNIPTVTRMTRGIISGVMETLVMVSKTNRELSSSEQPPQLTPGSEAVDENRGQYPRSASL